MRRSQLVRTVVLFKPEHDAGEVSQLAAFVRDMIMGDGRAAAYVCQEFSCLAPLTTVDELNLVFESMP